MRPNFRFSQLRLAALAALAGASGSVLFAQAIQVRDAAAAVAEAPLHREAVLPSAPEAVPQPGEVTLAGGLFRERRELTKAYVMRLKTEDLFQNHLLEAGVRLEKPIELMHQGWELPSCQLRGHFAGHWLSAAARFGALDHDAHLTARVSEGVQVLQRCQDLNHGQWVGSIPEKYFSILADGKEQIWSPQYTLHKTMMGLYDTWVATGDTQALRIAQHSADWFLTWTERMLKEGRGEAIYGGECAGMLELWSNLYGATKDERYLTLASRYAMPDMFRQLLAGGDPLSNQHSNASIPWIHGAARLYEVTGDVRYREIVARFWEHAVTSRGMFATTGNNAGEFWIPKGQFGRFIGNRTQEHCTVYNMVRVAQYLFRWTGEARYADYIERALYNGILAQQHPQTGMVAYFLPLQPGARKVWGSETRDFWCCHGTLVQAQAMYEDLIYSREIDGVSVTQFIPSRLAFGPSGAQVRISQSFDGAAEQANFSASGGTTHLVVNLAISCDQPSRWTLRVRQPAWAQGRGVVLVDGSPVDAVLSKTGFLEINREWKTATVKVSFAKGLVREPLPGDPQRFALLDGPVVLAAVGDKDAVLCAGSEPVPQYEHQYVDGREWQSGHYSVRTHEGTRLLKPLYEVGDEPYSVYLSSASEPGAGQH